MVNTGILHVRNQNQPESIDMLRVIITIASLTLNFGRRANSTASDAKYRVLLGLGQRFIVNNEFMEQLVVPKTSSLHICNRFWCGMVLQP